MTYDDVVTHFGKAPKAAAALGYTSRQAIYRWKKDGIPLGVQYRIQALTNGALKADEPQQEQPA